MTIAVQMKDRKEGTCISTATLSTVVCFAIAEFLNFSNLLFLIKNSVYMKMFVVFEKRDSFSSGGVY